MVRRRLPAVFPAEFEAAIKAEASQYAVVYLDTGQPLLGRPDLMSEDGLTRTQGYRALAAAVSAALTPELAPGHDRRRVWGESPERPRPDRRRLRSCKVSC